MQTRYQDSIPDLSGLKILCGSLDNIDNNAPFSPFADIIIELLNSVSKILMKDPSAKKYPDVITFGFFCRKANIIKYKKIYENRLTGKVGRGLLFHIAPSNVPVNFAYSLITGLLSGNANIIKASSKNFEQIRIICDALSNVLGQKEFESVRTAVTIVIYDRDRQDLTEFFSKICNVRIIWGGDHTIDSVRRAPLPPRSFDVTFADRYSLAIIDSEAILDIKLNEDKLKKLAQDFYNDTYLYDQNACTSPHLIYWLGNSKDSLKAQQIFWNAVYENIKDRYSVEAEVEVNKLMVVCKTAIVIPGSRLIKSIDNRIMRINIPTLSDYLPDIREAGGFFHEYCSESIEELKNIINEKYQTLSYFGCDPEALSEFVKSNGLRGIDRIIPIGKTSDWMFTWDGYDLIEVFSRRIVAL